MILKTRGCTGKINAGLVFTIGLLATGSAWGQAVTQVTPATPVAPVAQVKAKPANPFFWGTEVSGISCGLMVATLSNSNNAPIRCTPIIKNRANPMPLLWVWFLPVESCYQMTLIDQKGAVVAKTAKGKSLGKPITEPLMLKTGPNLAAGYKGRLIPRNKPEVLSDFDFDLQDYFKVTAPGRYRLKFEMRMVLQSSVQANPKVLHSTNFPMLTLPPVIADIDIKAGAGK